MSNEEVLSRKEMKAPDKFQVLAKSAIDWISGHKRRAEIGVGLAAAVVVFVGGGLMLSNLRADKAGALAYEVLRNVGGEVSAVPLPNVPGPFFATDADRQRAVVAAADQLLAEYPSTPAGRLGLLMKGDAELRLGQTAEAIASYERYLASVPSSNLLRFGAYEGIAIAREGEGKLEEAAAAWARAASEVATFADHADLERARVLAAAGKTEEARKLLDGFAERHKGSTYAPDAAAQLARLGGK